MKRTKICKQILSLTQYHRPLGWLQRPKHVFGSKHGHDAQFVKWYEA